MKQKVYKGHIIERALTDDWIALFEQQYETERIKAKSEAARKKRKKPALERRVSRIETLLQQVLEKL